MSYTCVLQREHSGDRLCEESTLCKHDRRNGDLVVELGCDVAL